MKASELPAYLRSLARVYADCLKRAVTGTIINWWAPFIPAAYLIILLAVGAAAAPLGIVGGFILGFLMAGLIAHYLSLVHSSVLQEKIGFRQSFEEARELLYPVISILFALFIIDLLLGTFSGGGAFLAAAINLIIVVLLNALPETAYFGRRGFAAELFSNSFEFIKENAPEWFAPQLLLLLPLIALSPELFLLEVASTNPLYFPQLVAAKVRGLGPGLLFSLLGLVLAFFLMVFRGLLYRELATSGRRKRLYQDKLR